MIEKNIYKITRLGSRKIGWLNRNGKILLFSFPADFRFWRLAVMIRNDSKNSIGYWYWQWREGRHFYPLQRGRQKPIYSLKPFSCFSKFFYNNSFTKSFRMFKYKSFISEKININQILFNKQVSSISIFDYLFLEVNHP